MKKSKDWVYQEDLLKKVKAWFTSNSGGAEDKTPNQIAGEIGVTSNGKFYKAYTEVVRLREAEAELPALDIPSEVKAEFQNVLSIMTCDATDAFLRTVRAVAGDIDRSADLRIMDAQRRAANAVAERDGLVDRWIATEEERDAALEELGALQQRVDELQRQVDRLEGRLAEREFIAAANRNAVLGIPAEAKERGTVALENSETRTSGGGQPEAAASAGSPSLIGATAGCIGVEAGRQSDQPSISEGVGPTGQQSELSLGSKDTANSAVADDAEHG